MFDLQNGYRSRRLATAIVCQVFATLALSGCGGSLGGPPKEFLHQCMRVQMADDSLRDSSVGLVQLGEFVGVIEGNTNATVTWEKDGDGAYILHDVIQDRVKGTEMTVDLKFADLGDAVASDVCGPRQVAATRVVLNGIELKGYDKVAFIDKLIIKTRH